VSALGRKQLLAEFLSRKSFAPKLGEGKRGGYYIELARVFLIEILCVKLSLCYPKKKKGLSD
jgi:hypothetical protein